METGVAKLVDAQRMH